jgi:hypothetical protein
MGARIDQVNLIPSDPRLALAIPGGLIGWHLSSGRGEVLKPTAGRS